MANILAKLKYWTYIFFFQKKKALKLLLYSKFFLIKIDYSVFNFH